MSIGVDLIAAERERQVSVEGWTESHDASVHDSDDLAMAASLYAMPQRKRHADMLWWLWPWDASWWKPTPQDRIRELVKAGALIAAEIDRLKMAGDLSGGK
jgi:hypothetical protein